MKQPAEILLVEDDDMLRDAFRMLLENAGYVVHEAATAAQAIEAATARPPAAILLDLGLPDRPGLDVVRDLRSREPTHATPIIALTGRAGSEQERACREAGCTHFFAKPLESRTLLRELPRFLRHD